MTNSVYYFAYGSNMAVERLKNRVESAEKICVTKLEGYLLMFHKVSKKDGSGKCDIINTGKLEDKVYGVLFKVQSNNLGTLDKYEGRGYGYERTLVKVTSESGETFDAETYVATDINTDIRPYLWYKEHVLRGAKASGLPEAYISMINAVDCDEDPDLERQVREMAIYN